MRVLKLVGEGITASFRYPHFMQGIHPTYEFPPPATIYGHICSALGEWVDPDGLEFAYHFTHAGKFDDVEHIHVLSGSSGKLPGTKLPKVLEGAVNPFKRQMLFRPKLVLYINRPEWLERFRNPHYTLTLGRSQDLFTYTDLSVIDLVQAEQAYFEHTLAPYQMTLNLASGYAMLMPRYLDYERNRQPTWARYMLLTRRIDSRHFFYIEGQTQPQPFWIDPATPQMDGVPMGLWFHSFVGQYDDQPSMA